MFLDRATGTLFNAGGEAFDPWHWAWQARGHDRPAAATPVEPPAALAHLGRTGEARRVPVGVIGPGDATAEQAALAEALGEALARHGLTVVCGGRTGAMAAVCRGVRRAGGLSVGLLPGSDWRQANADVVLPIATGLGEARNMIIAKSCAALIAVGGSYGTLTEVAYGLHFDKLVIGLADAPDIDGVAQVRTVDAAIDLLAGYLLGSPRVS